jgi:predicted nucleotidyltransferase
MFLVNKIIRAISDLEFVHTVKIVGSLNEENNDLYSDIDLEVSIKHLSSDKALLIICELLTEKFSPLWSDYANSLVPNKFLVSMFFENENPFRFIDIGIVNNGVHSIDKDRFQNDIWIHLTKLWIMNFKLYLRRDERFDVRFEKMMLDAGIKTYTNHADGFRKLLILLSTKQSVNHNYLLQLNNEFNKHLK